jgi:hypothetical protein
MSTAYVRFLCRREGRRERGIVETHTAEDSQIGQTHSDKQLGQVKRRGVGAGFRWKLAHEQREDSRRQVAVLVIRSVEGLTSVSPSFPLLSLRPPLPLSLHLRSRPPARPPSHPLFLPPYRCLSCRPAAALRWSCSRARSCLASSLCPTPKFVPEIFAFFYFWEGT